MQLLILPWNGIPNSPPDPSTGISLAASGASSFGSTRLVNLKPIEENSDAKNLVKISRSGLWRPGLGNLNSTKASCYGVLSSTNSKTMSTRLFTQTDKHNLHVAWLIIPLEHKIKIALCGISNLPMEVLEDAAMHGCLRHASAWNLWKMQLAYAWLSLPCK